MITPEERWVVLIWDAKVVGWVAVRQHEHVGEVREAIDDLRRELGTRHVRLLHTADSQI